MVEEVKVLTQEAYGGMEEDGRKFSAR